MRLKPIHEQVIVITGASSGIGLATARLAARRGACVVLAARNEPALREMTEEINASGGHAAYVVADVGREEDVVHIARVAVERFGRIDTWFNNAAAFIFGRLIEVPTDEHRRLFDTNYWGVVYGSRTAVKYLRHHGGALINMGSGLGTGPSQFKARTRHRSSPLMASPRPCGWKLSKGAANLGHARQAKFHRHAILPHAREELPPAGREEPASGVRSEYRRRGRSALRPTPQA